MFACLQTLHHSFRVPMLPDIEVRASVNMRLGTIRAMEYAAAWFDGFYLQRDLQRNPDQVRQASNWCREHGKRLGLLVNSGCLRFCPGQIYHDNAVAHDAQSRAAYPAIKQRPAPRAANS